MMRRMSIDPRALPVSIEPDPDRHGGRRIGVLLSHGFTGSPASMRPWAEHLGAQGYGVRVPRLPGHGTTWQELNATTWEDWYAEVERTFTDLRRTHDAVVVGGLSMGGALVLRLAAEHADEVRGVVVVNPAVASTRLDLKLLPVLKHVVGSLPGIGDDIKKEGVTEGGYDRTPLKALHSFARSWPTTRQALRSVTAPLLYFRSTVDHVVDEASQPLIVRGVSSGEVTEVALENSYHVATLDHDAPRIFADSVDFVARVTA